MPHWYISGPMSGLPDHNVPAFAECAHWLRQHGHEHVVSPHEILPDRPAWKTRVGDVSIQWFEVQDWNAHTRADIAALVECDHLVLLPGWPQSRGSRLELTIAMDLGFKVFTYDALAEPRMREVTR